MTWLARR
jgi:hypothetical protein